MSCVIVLGCYRTGTSAIAGALHHLGVHMGDEFDPPADSNPKGYFEDISLKIILKQVDVDPSTIEILKEYVESREQNHSIWGVKTPELCLALQPFLDCLSTESKIIATFRPKADICKSLAKATSTDADFWTSLVDRYVSSQEELLSRYPGPILTIDFRTLMQGARPTVEMIAEFVGIPFQEEAVSFIDPSINKIAIPTESLPEYKDFVQRE